MPPKIPKAPEEYIDLMRKVIAGTATPQEVELAKNLPAINAGVMDENAISASKPDVPHAMLTGAIANENRQKKLLGNDY